MNPAVALALPVTLFALGLGLSAEAAAGRRSFAAALLAVLTVPLLAWLYSSAFGLERWAIRPGAVLRQVATLPGVLGFFARDGLALALMAVMALGSLAIGYLLAGRDPIARTTAPLVTSMRNPGLALVFASSNGAQLKGLKVAILAHVLITALVALPFVRWRKRQRPGA